MGDCTRDVLMLIDVLASSMPLLELTSDTTPHPPDSVNSITDQHLLLYELIADILSGLHACFGSKAANIVIENGIAESLAALVQLEPIDPVSRGY